MTAVLYQVNNGVATLTLNRAEVLNALNGEMIEGLRNASARAEFDPSIRAVVIRGAGDHFMAGGDLKWFQQQLSLPPRQRQPMFERVTADVHATTLQLKRMSKPVIASVQGAVAGFGLSLMMAADLALAADDAYFTLAYRHVGLSPDGGATWSLPRLVGLRHAMEIALLGDRFDATRARELGLINRVVPLIQLEAETIKLAQRLASGPNEALAHTKMLLNQSINTTLETQLHAEQRSFGACTASPDFAEGLTAFFDKRPPQFRRVD